ESNGRRDEKPIAVADAITGIGAGLLEVERPDRGLRDDDVSSVHLESDYEPEPTEPELTSRQTAQSKDDPRPKIESSAFPPRGEQQQLGSDEVFTSRGSQNAQESDPGQSASKAPPSQQHQNDHKPPLLQI